MYSQVIEKIGVSQSSLEIIVLCIIAIAIAGYILVAFSKQIIIGAMAIFCFMVFTQAGDTKVMAKGNSTEKIEKIQEEAEDKKAYMEDCQRLTDYSKQKCDDIWENRETQEQTKEEFIPTKVSMKKI